MNAGQRLRIDLAHGKFNEAGTNLLVICYIIWGGNLYTYMSLSGNDRLVLEITENFRVLG